jgi:formate dehydrogenase maturation protein FdhE
MTNNEGSHADPIAARLRELVNESPALPDLESAAHLYETILPLMRDADLNPEPLSITEDEAHAKLGSGLPLLVDLDLDLDLAAMRRLMIDLASAVESFNETVCKSPQQETARRIRAALEEDWLDIESLMPDIAAGERSNIEKSAVDLQLDPGLLWTLSQNALKPALRAWSRQLQPFAVNCNWRQSYCPVCGAIPVLGELREDHQAKYLRCNQCGADWPAPRLQCIHCGNDDHKTLGYLYSDPHPEKILAEFCDNCKGYLKLITTFAPTSAEMLPVEDLATLYLDYAARDRGYGPGHDRTVTGN